MNCATIFCLALLIAGTFASGERYRIHGGENANIRDFPYQVSLRTYGWHNCGGSIVSRRHVVTAAHCVHDGEQFKVALENTAVLTGTALSDGKSGRFYRMERIAVHDGWTNKMEDWFNNDIAVIKLSEDIEFNELTKAIDLTSRNVEPGTRVVTTGWGLNGSSIIAPALVLQKLNVTIMSSAECERSIVNFKIHPGQVCIRTKKGASTCTADSGGPLVAGNLLVGVTSWGVGGCGNGYPNVFASVYHYRDWILKQMRDL